MACDTIQNFCASCQKAGQHSDIFCQDQVGGFKFSKSSEKNNKAFYNFINEAISAIKKIGNYGTKGTKKPSLEQLNTLKEVFPESKISHEDFNQLLSVLNISDKDIKSKQRLLGSYMIDLVNYINEYELSSNLCDDCNESCQSGQNCYQGGDDCGEGSCSGGSCLGGICGPLIGCSGCDTGAQGCQQAGCTCQSSQGCATHCQLGCMTGQ